MAVYCVPRSDEDIISDAADSKSILAVACPSCANIGYYLNGIEDSPIIKFTFNGIQAVCSKSEIERLSDLFVQNGKETAKRLFSYPNAVCMLNDKERERLKDIGGSIDTILAMCCESGQKNLASIFPEKKFISGMNAQGILKGKTRKGFGKFFLDKDSIEILKFDFDKTQS